MKAFSYIVTILLVIPVAMFTVLLAAAPAMAAGPGWQDVPERLKKGPGVEFKGGYVYATGAAKAANIRPDKAHEIARKKSLLHALKLLHVASSCHEIVKGLRPEEQEDFNLMLTPISSPLHVEGLSVIRQWEKGTEHFTTVGVSQSALKNVPCEFSDLSEAISRYISLEDVTLQGLAFCLRHVPRYSSAARTVRRRIGRLYQERGSKGLVRCFVEDRGETIRISSFEVLALQNRMANAAQLNLLAEEAARKRNWNEAVDLASRSLEILPTYGKAYLVLADYFLQAEKRPSFALCASEKALRDGTCTKEALEKLTSCLKALKNPETEVYQFLSAQLVEDAGSTYPKPWQHEIDRLGNTLVPYLVLVSFGQAVEGESASPDSGFNRAAALFGQAKSDQDVANVLDLLLEACEKQTASAETYNLIGACYRHLGNPALALPFLWQALRLKPEYDYALTNLALCSQKLGLMQAAKYYFESKAVTKSTNPWVRECYAKFHEERQ